MGKKFANEDTRLRTRHTLEILGNDDMYESEGKERVALFSLQTKTCIKRCFWLSLLLNKDMSL